MSRSSRPIHPEDGSRDGVHLRDGSLRDDPGQDPPAGFLDGALYCVYVRAHSKAGTLEAVTRDLDRIRALGASAVWLLPVHPTGIAGRKGSAGSPYAIRDYRAVDPALGTEADLKRLVDAAHERGLRIILDFVANHAANDHPLAATHPDRFLRDADGTPTRRVADWSDVIDWDHADPEVTEHLVGSALHWVRDLGFDGFRCDVAGMVPAAFWKRLGTDLGEAHPAPFLLAEWQDAALHTVAFHASYDWQLYRALRDCAVGRKDATAVDAALVSWDANFPRRAIPMRFLENHDEPRVLSFLEPERVRAYAAVAFLSGGLPLLYAGQEAGARHRPSLFEAEPVDWDEAPETATVYTDLLELRRREPALGAGRAVPVATSAPESVVAFERRADDRAAVVIAHLGTEPVTVRVAVDRPFRGLEAGAGGLDDDAAMGLEPGEVWIGTG